jgi:hypothetical protein
LCACSDIKSFEYAVARDKADPLATFRFQFAIPSRLAIEEYEHIKAARASADGPASKKHKAAETKTDEKKGSSSAASAAATAEAAPTLTRSRSQSDQKDGDECVYLCGNSLGLQPKRALEFVMEEMTKWQKTGVEGHFLGARPW